MGAPKQKWTQEEEAALKAGVIKHGAGKWRTILKDPEFSSVLYLRSNVDLKDKWRNMSVMANGWGSRDKARLAVKRTLTVPKQEDTTMGQSSRIPSDEEFADVKALAASSSAQPIPIVPKRSIVRLDNLIIEAITSLKEPGGSNKTTIAAYIEDKYWAPTDFKRILSAKLKYLTTCGKLIKVKRKYRIAPVLPYPQRTNPAMLLSEERQPASPRVEIDDIVIPTMEEIELELAKMRTMTPQEAAAAAAKAMAEAEAAIAAAEQAAREADEAEAEAARAQALAEEAMKELEGRKSAKMGPQA
ncbi:hypothetical protein SLE2022_156380 [Rubroshorea leprosula]